jgi:hypothetical protein
MRPPDAAEPNVHGFEVLTVGLIDVAVVALLLAEPLPCAGAHGDADIQGDDRGGPSRLVGSLLHPSGRTAPGPTASRRTVKWMPSAPMTRS